MPDYDLKTFGPALARLVAAGRAGPLSDPLQS